MTRTEIQLRARLRRAERLLMRWAAWHSDVPDEPIIPANCIAGLAQRTRELLKRNMSAEPRSKRP